MQGNNLGARGDRRRLILDENGNILVWSPSQDSYILSFLFDNAGAMSQWSEEDRRYLNEEECLTRKTIAQEEEDLGIFWVK